MSRLSDILRDTTDGFAFHCPGCKTKHRVSIGPDGWTWNGNADKPTFTPSILVTYPHWIPPATPENPDPGAQTRVVDTCHSFVTDGQIQFLGDCTHELAGQTVPLPPFDYPNEGNEG